MMEALLSSETTVLTRATLRNIPEDGFLHFNTPWREKRAGGVGISSFGIRRVFVLYMDTLAKMESLS
jgi:hypothetical protein